MIIYKKFIICHLDLYHANIPSFEIQQTGHHFCPLKVIIKNNIQMYQKFYSIITTCLLHEYFVHYKNTLYCKNNVTSVFVSSQVFKKFLGIIEFIVRLNLRKPHFLGYSVWCFRVEGFSLYMKIICTISIVQNSKLISFAILVYQSLLFEDS